MAAAGVAREFIRFNLIQPAVFRVVRRSLFKVSGAAVAVQTFAIVVRFVEHWFFGHSSKVLDIQMPKPSHLRFEISKHRVVRMAGVACLVARNSIVLKMSGGEVGGIIYSQAGPILLHDVAGRAECGVL